GDALGGGQPGGGVDRPPGDDRHTGDRDELAGHGHVVAGELGPDPVQLVDPDRPVGEVQVLLQQVDVGLLGPQVGVELVWIVVLVPVVGVPGEDLQIRDAAGDRGGQG